MRLQSIWDPLRETAVRWWRDKAPRLSAALAFYTIFSLAPLLIIVIAIAGQVFGPPAVQGEIVRQFETLIGHGAAEQIQTMIENAYDPESNRIAGVIGAIALLIGAMGVFTELKDALNTVWAAIPQPRRGIWGFLRDRVLSLTMIFAVAFLLLASLVVSAALSAVSKWASDLLPASALALQAGNFLLSFLVISLLFAMIYRILPDVRIGWRDASVGGAATALLFTVGKEMIGAYLGRSGLASIYGAAGSLAILLVWVYYSAAIFLLGAEFTEVFSRRWGDLSGKRSGPKATPPRGRKAGDARHPGARALPASRHRIDGQRN